MNKKKALLWTVIILLLVGSVSGAYFLTARFLAERQSMMNRADMKRQVRFPQNTTTTKRVYTQKELAEARKKGTLPPDVKQPYMPNTAGDAAVQQSLRTIEEINKINTMNQKLMDQQRRIQNQNR